MPWIPFYADDSDFFGIIDYLNKDDDIAFIVGAGPTTWKAVSKVNYHYLHETTLLWHIPGGPLPLVKELQPNEIIKDPFAGWEDHDPQDMEFRKTPYFGSSPVVIELYVNVEGKRNPEAIGISGFGWIGNRYSVIGSPAPAVTKAYWEKVRRWVSKNCTKKISRVGPLDSGTQEIFAFRSAYEKFLGGTEREEYP